MEFRKKKSSNFRTFLRLNYGTCRKFREIQTKTFIENYFLFGKKCVSLQVFMYNHKKLYEMDVIGKLVSNEFLY